MIFSSFYEFKKEQLPQQYEEIRYVGKDTFQNMINKKISTNSHLLTLKWSEYLCQAMFREIHRYIWPSNWFMGRGLKKGKTDGHNVWILIQMNQNATNDYFSLFFQDGISDTTGLQKLQRMRNTSTILISYVLITFFSQILNL